MKIAMNQSAELLSESADASVVAAGPNHEPSDAGLLRDGYSFLARTESARTINALQAFDRLAINSQSGSCRISVTHELVTLLIGQTGIAEFLADTVGPDARAVRAIAFDKTGESNWFVPWHQDRTIAVQCRDERADVAHWTVKNGNPHCEPPIALLESMMTLRWHLDPVCASDGPLKILPTTHCRGRLQQAAIHALAQTIDPIELTAERGDVVAMRPLLVHASGRRTSGGCRRIVHVEFAAGDPPRPLQWAQHSTMAT